MKGVLSAIQSGVYKRLRERLFTISKLHPYPNPQYLDIFTAPTLFIHIDRAVDTQASAGTERTVRAISVECLPGSKGLLLLLLLLLLIIIIMNNSTTTTTTTNNNNNSITTSTTFTTTNNNYTTNTITISTRTTTTTTTATTTTTTTTTTTLYKRRQKLAEMFFACSKSFNIHISFSNRQAVLLSSHPFFKNCPTARRATATSSISTGGHVFRRQIITISQV